MELGSFAVTAASCGSHKPEEGQVNKVCVPTINGLGQRTFQLPQRQQKWHLCVSAALKGKSAVSTCVNLLTSQHSKALVCSCRAVQVARVHVTDSACSVKTSSHKRLSFECCRQGHTLLTILLFACMFSFYLCCKRVGNMNHNPHCPQC